MNQPWIYMIEGWLLYNIGLISAIQQHELAMGVHMSLYSWTSLPPPPAPLGCYTAPAWAPPGIQQISIGLMHLFELIFFPGYMPWGGIAGSYGSSIFNFLRTPPYCFSQLLHQFTFPPVIQEGSLFGTATLAFVVCRLFNDDHSDQCEMVTSL